MPACTQLTAEESTDGNGLPSNEHMGIAALAVIALIALAVRREG